MANLLGVLLDGIAYGSLLFVVSIGLAVTMGLMNFVNLAHGAFAMFGGYVCVVLVMRAGVPYFAALALAFATTALVGALLERLLYRRLYTAGHLDQVLFSIGLAFVAVAAASYLSGPTQQGLQLPGILQGRHRLLSVEVGAYQLFLIVFVLLVTLVLGYLIERTRFGAQVRASVDNPVAAAAAGINVSRVFALTFALGSGLAGLGGALGVEVLAIEPTYPLKYLVYFLMIAAVGGSRTIKGPLAAALLLGVFDVAGRYYVPELGAFVIYALMVLLLVLFPAGLRGRAA